MKKADFEHYSEAVNKLKRRFNKLESNNFNVVSKSKSMLENKECLFFETDSCVCLAVPGHGAYYRLYYHASGKEGISEGLRTVNKEYDKKIPLICTVVGSTDFANDIIPYFTENEYTLRKRMRRFIYLRSKKNDFSADSCAEFALAEDAEEILDMIFRYFDIYSQAIPELTEIKENAIRKQISIVRRNAKIAALLYYEVHGSSLHNIFEIVSEDYRKDLLNVDLMAHRDKGLKERGLEIKLLYSWRDMDNKKVIEIGEYYAKRYGILPRDTVVYTFFRS